MFIAIGFSPVYTIIGKVKFKMETFSQNFSFKQQSNAVAQCIEEWSWNKISSP